MSHAGERRNTLKSLCAFSTDTALISVERSQSLAMLLAALSTRLFAPLLRKGWATLQAPARPGAEGYEESSIQGGRSTTVKHEPDDSPAPARPYSWQTMPSRPTTIPALYIPPYRAALDHDLDLGGTDFAVSTAPPTRKREGWKRSGSAPL